MVSVGVNDGKISNADYVLDHLRDFVNSDGIYSVSTLLSVTSSAVASWLEKKTTMTLKTVAKIGDLIGLSVAEMMVRPGVETEWYREADVKYLALNLDNYVEELCESKAYMAHRLGIAKATLQAYVYGGTKPRLPMLQKMADVLDVEVADLFLPVEEDVVS